MKEGLQPLLLVLPLIVAACYIAWRALLVRPDRFRLSDYFLARGDIGPRKTRANALNNNFALANILWLFVVWGYYFGPVTAILLEIPWCISLFFVGRIAPVILDSARAGNTLHGFIGQVYNSERLRVLCAGVTATGYLLNFGFEVYVSAGIIGAVLGGASHLQWVIAIGLALVAASYISMCGFLGNVSQDTTQNKFGLFATLVFAAALTFAFLGKGTGAGHALTNPFFVGVSIPAALGIIAYTSVFNLVDVSNWQGVGANKALPSPAVESDQRRSWTQTAVGAWLFSCIGAYLGYLLRGKSGLKSNQLFPELIAMLSPDAPGILHSALVGLVVGGFFVLALGYAENLLSAAQLTFIADVLRRQEYDKLVTADQESATLLQDEDTFVRKCQRTTFGLVILSLTFFYFALTLLGEQEVLDFMFIIFGSAISMFPAVMYAAIRRKRGECADLTLLRWPAAASIILGYVICVLPVLIPTIPDYVRWVGGTRSAEIAPFVALVSSFGLFHIWRLLLKKGDPE